MAVPPAAFRRRPFPMQTTPPPPTRVRPARPPAPARPVPPPPRRPPGRLTDPETWGTFGLRLCLLAFVIVGAALLMGASLAPTARVASTLLGAVGNRLDELPPLPAELGDQAERSVVLARDGTRLAVLRVENRKTVALHEIPPHVQQAVIATEDSAFREHRGVNWRAIVRAALGNVRAGEVTSGASTITQQVVKNAIVGGDVTLDRKLREAIYALQIEKRLTKDQILETYLNEAYFANGVYGIATAAEYYWGKDIGELTVGEAAVLAGMIRSPERNDPKDHPLAARQRRDIVLEQMGREGYLRPSQVLHEKSQPLRLDVHELAQPRNPFFVDYVRALLKEDPALGEDRQARDLAVLRGGLTIHTTLEPELQDIAQDVITEAFSRGEDPLAALTAVDPRTGEILAIGFGPKPYGKGPGETEVNPAVPGLGSSGRQPGSSFKAFQVVAALEDGIPPGYSFEAGARYTHTDPGCRGHTIGNYADASQGLLDMGSATAKSSNTYFAHLLDLTGPEKLVDVASRMGITTPLHAYCSLVLGGQEVFPLDMASAFGTLANGGVHCAPFAIDRVEDRQGRVLSRGGNHCDRAVEAGIAARAAALLRGPIDGGTASRNGRLGRPAAGKTGTTTDAKDAWFVGFIPQLSAAVWVGHETPAPMTHPSCGREVTGGCLPTMIWQRFMSRAISALSLPVESFPSPPAVPTMAVPDVTGLLEDEATEILEGADFRVLSEQAADHRPAGTVVGQSPGGGERAPRGSAIVLRVSDGEGAVPTLPLFVGMTQAEAEAALEELGLRADVTLEPVEDRDERGTVIGQEPEAGTAIDELRTVQLIVGGDLVEPSVSPAPQPAASPATGGDAEPTSSPRPEPTRTSGGEDDSEPPPPPSPAPGPDPGAEPTAEPEPPPEGGGENGDQGGGSGSGSSDGDGGGGGGQGTGQEP